MTNLISTFISLRTLLYNKNFYQDFYFNSFIEDKYEYFTFLRKKGIRWYNNYTLKMENLKIKYVKF